MEKQTLATLAASIENWRAPEVPADIPHGDMPGDKVEINQGHIQKANLIFPLLVPLAARPQRSPAAWSSRCAAARA